MIRSSVYVTSDATTTGGFWAFDGTSTGGFAAWGNRPRAKIPRELRALLVDPRVIFLSCSSVWVSWTTPNGEVSGAYAIRVDELATVGVASNVETREVEYWASFRHRRDAYQVLPDRDDWEKIFVGSPPERLIRGAAREYVNRRMPTAISSMSSTTSYSYWR